MFSSSAVNDVGGSETSSERLRSLTPGVESFTSDCGRETRIGQPQCEILIKLTTWRLISSCSEATASAGVALGGGDDTEKEKERVS